MSIIVALKDGDEMYLGTDSRFMNPEETAPVSDSVQKIHSVGPGAFIATSGYQHACSFQAARAPELARALCITDIEVIGEALARESLPTLRELVAFLSAIVQRGPAGGYKHGADQKGGRLMPVSGERSKPMSKTGRGCAEGVPSVTLRADNPVHVKVLILAQHGLDREMGPGMPAAVELRRLTREFETSGSRDGLTVSCAVPGGPQFRRFLGRMD